MQPRQMRETERPVRPSRRNSMMMTLEKRQAGRVSEQCHIMLVEARAVENVEMVRIPGWPLRKSAIREEDGRVRQLSRQVRQRQDEAGRWNPRSRLAFRRRSARVQRLRA